MKLKITVKLADDVPFRFSYSPYKLDKSDLKDAIHDALDDAIDAANNDATDMTATVKRYGDAIGTLRITVK